MVQSNSDNPIMRDAPSSKLLLVLGMQSFGIRMMRQNLLRRHPGESTHQIDQRLSEWLAKNPDADDPRFEVRRCKTLSKDF